MAHQVGHLIARSLPGWHRLREPAAHEPALYLLGDEYQSDVGGAASRDERERPIDAFAAELLRPQQAARGRWAALEGFRPVAPVRSDRLRSVGDVDDPAEALGWTVGRVEVGSFPEGGQLAAHLLQIRDPLIHILNSGV